MSKNDMLGPVTRALVSVPQNRLSIIAKIANQLAGENGEALHASLVGLLEQIRSASAQQGQSNDLKIVVDYDLSLQEMIAAGQYDLVNDDITPERFPVIGKGVMQLISQLVHFNRNISSDDAEKELDKKGLRPATLAELLAFGKTYPEVQRKFPVVALGSVARIYGNRYVTYLDGSDSKRHLDLGCRGIDWPARFRFLAFPK